LIPKLAIMGFPTAFETLGLFKLTGAPVGTAKFWTCCLSFSIGLPGEPNFWSTPFDCSDIYGICVTTTSASTATTKLPASLKFMFNLLNRLFMEKPSLSPIF